MLVNVRKLDRNVDKTSGNKKAREKKERKKETKDKVRKRRKPIKRTNKCKGIIEENRRNIC